MNFTNGVHNITNEQYHASNGVSRSALMKLRKSKFHYWYEYLSNQFIKPDDTEALIFGNALHTMILEPNEFDKRYFVADKVDRRTKEGKFRHSEMMQEAGDRILITDHLHFKLQLMNESIKRNEQAAELLKNGKAEQSIYWTDEETGLVCKCRPDLWHKNMIIDLKTTASAAYRDFQSSCYKYGYHIQAGMIQEGVKSVTGQIIKDFVFIATEKEAPYATAVYILDDEAIAQGVREFKKLLKTLKKSQVENDWSTYDTQILTLPAYAQYDEVSA